MYIPRDIPNLLKATHTHIYTFLTHFRTFFYSWIKLRYSVQLHLSTCEHLNKNFIMCTKKQTCILLYLLQILIHFSNGKEFSFEKVNSQISKSTYLLKGKTNFYRGQHRYRFEWSAYSKIILIFFSNIEIFWTWKLIWDSS